MAGERVVGRAIMRGFAKLLGSEGRGAARAFALRQSAEVGEEIGRLASLGNRTAREAVEELVRSTGTKNAELRKIGPNRWRWRMANIPDGDGGRIKGMVELALDPQTGNYQMFQGGRTISTGSLGAAGPAGPGMTAAMAGLPSTGTMGPQIGAPRLAARRIGGPLMEGVTWGARHPVKAGLLGVGVYAAGQYGDVQDQAANVDPSAPLVKTLRDIAAQQASALRVDAAVTRLTKATDDNLRLMAAFAPHTLNEVAAGRKLARGVVPIGGDPRARAARLAELGLQMSRGGYANPDPQSALAQQLGILGI